MSDGLDVGEFLVGFLAEADEHLAAARACLTRVDEAAARGEHDPKAVRELFRSLHTLKGLSAMVGAEPIVDLAHELETLLRSADRAGGRLPPAAVDAVLKGVHAIEERVRSLSSGQPLAPAPKALIEVLAGLQLDARPPQASGELRLPPELLAKLTLAEQEQLLLALSKGRRAVRTDFLPSQERSAQGLNITRVRERMSKVGELVKVMPRSLLPSEGGAGGVAFVLLLVTDASDQAVAEAAATSPEKVQSIGVTSPALAELLADQPADEADGRKHNFVRVEVSRLDDTLERLSALVVSRARLQRAVAELPAELAATRNLTQLIAESGRQLKELRAAIMRSRMVPVVELLDRAPLLVRGLSRSAQKLVRLNIEAGTSELDKAVADRLFPAVVHLLRNAVDHAIEAPAERLAAGKSEEGHIRISCAHPSASQLALVVSDDGRGIDRDKVARKSGAAVPRDDAELLALIARPGLSTLDAATHVSGRGLGVDIVRRIVVDELGGQLRLSTTRGAGTSFTLVVPLSITILDVFSLRCGGSTFVVPVSAVEELAELEPAMVTQAPHPAEGFAAVRLLTYRGSALPLYTLGALLGLAAPRAERPQALIVRSDAGSFAVEVDKLLGQHEVVVRPLTDPLVTVSGVSGSTDLGDGVPTLVLDPVTLMQRAGLRREQVRS